MLSSTAEYALRAAVCLATSQDQARTAQQISEITLVSPAYLSKILQDLVRAGLARSQRGPSGGFTLTRSPTDISILDVINAVDPIQRIRECPLGIPSHGKNLCRLHKRLDESIAHVEGVFRQSSLAELTDPTPSGHRCLFPTVERRRTKHPSK